MKYAEDYEVLKKFVSKRCVCLNTYLKEFCILVVVTVWMEKETSKIN